MYSAHLGRKEKVRSSSVELVQVRSRLQAAEKKASEPPPLLLKLQEELSQMKVVCIDVYVRYMQFYVCDIFKSLPRP